MGILDAPSRTIEKRGLYLPADWGSNWAAAKKQAGTRLAKATVAGDSVARGYFTNLLDTNSWVALMRSELQAKYGDGGSGFISPTADADTSTPTGYPAQLKVSKVGTTYGSRGLFGPYPGTTMMNSTDCAITFQTRGTIVEITWIAASGLGTFTYSIDGGTAVQVVTAAASGSTQRTVVSGLASGQHTVVIAAQTVGGGIHISGVSGYNASGVVLNSHTKQGGNTGELTTSNTYGAITRQTGGRDNPVDLLVIAYGLNDETANTTGAAFEVAVRNYLDDVQEGTNGATDIVLLLNHRGPNWGGGNKQYHAYSDALRTLASSYGCAYINLWGYFRNSWQLANSQNYWSTGTGTTGNPGTDQAHPGTTGHALQWAAMKALLPQLTA